MEIKCSIGCLRRRPRLAVQLVCCTRSRISGSFRNRTRRFEGLHVLGIRLLHPSRQFLHRELQLTSVLTEIAGPHRPRWVASSTLCIKLLAIFFVSRPNTRSPHSFAFRCSVPSVTPVFSASSSRLSPPSAPGGYSTVCSGGSLLAHRSFPHWVPSQLSS